MSNKSLIYLKKRKLNNTVTTEIRWERVANYDSQSAKKKRLTTNDNAIHWVESVSFHVNVTTANSLVLVASQLWSKTIELFPDIVLDDTLQTSQNISGHVGTSSEKSILPSCAKARLARVGNVGHGLGRGSTHVAQLLPRCVRLIRGKRTIELVNCLLYRKK